MTIQSAPDLLKLRLSKRWESGGQAAFSGNPRLSTLPQVHTGRGQPVGRVDRPSSWTLRRRRSKPNLQNDGVSSGAPQMASDMR